MRWTPWSGFFFERWQWWVPTMGHMRSGGLGDQGSLPNSFGCEFISFIKTLFYGGAPTSHFMEEHSSPTSIFPVFMMTSSNGNIFRITGFCTGNSPVTTGTHRSPANFPHTDRWRGAFMFSLICAWTNGWVNNQDAGDLWRHCNVVPNSDPVIRAAVGSFGVQRVTLAQFWIGETGQIGGFRVLWKEWPQIWHTALPWLPFLEINYICTQWQFKFAVSDHPWISFELGSK